MIIPGSFMFRPDPSTRPKQICSTPNPVRPRPQPDSDLGCTEPWHESDLPHALWLLIGRSIFLARQGPPGRASFRPGPASSRAYEAETAQHRQGLEPPGRRS